MKHIYKKISLDRFKCKLPNTLVSFSGDNELHIDIDTFFIEHPNGNYGAYPSDIIIPVEYAQHITDLTSISVNYADGDNHEFYKITYDDNYNLSYESYGEKFTIGKCLSYQKLHKWYIFFKKYFRLLRDTQCKFNKECTAKQEYFSAQEYYVYNLLDSDEDMATYKKMDELFVARGGTLGYYDDLTGTNVYATCPFFTWMENYIFIELTIPQKFQKAWKNTTLNICSFMEWFLWFQIRYNNFYKYQDFNSKQEYCEALNGDNEWNKGLLQENLCDFIHYTELGGNEIYTTFFYSVYTSLSWKLNMIGDLCIGTATISVPITLQVSNNNIGEQTSLLEKWESKVNYLNDEKSNPGTVISYGGSSFLHEEDNDIVTVPESTFISSVEPNHRGYKLNSYDEAYFIEEDANKKVKSLFEEYLPHYIRQHPEEFDISDYSTPIETYSYNNTKFVPNPTDSSMCKKYKITLPSSNDYHLFWINDEIHESQTAYTVSINGEEYLVKYLDETQYIPYIEYRNKQIYGYYDKEYKYKFRIKRNKCNADSWVYANDVVEYIIFKEKLYYVHNGNVVIPYIIRGESGKYIYKPIYGYFRTTNDLNLIASVENELYVVNVEGHEGAENICLQEFTINNYIFGNRKDKNPLYQESKSYGYWFDSTNPTEICVIEPYSIFLYGYVTGYTRSKIETLVDSIKTYDRLGNSIDGSYRGEHLYPTRTEILDIPYHVGNTYNLTIISEEEDNTKIVFGTTPNSSNVNYYWGDIISNISFYFKDNNDKILYITDTEKTIDVNTIYRTKPTKNSIENLSFIKEAIKKYVIKYGYQVNSEEELNINIENTPVVGFKMDVFNKNNIIYDKTLDSYHIVTDTFFDADGTEEYYASKYITVNRISDILKEINDTLCCEITYNQGAIIQRPYLYSNNEYTYGMYGLSYDKDKKLIYHKGVEYKEEYEISFANQPYYTDKNRFFDITYLTLTPKQTLTYYLDEYVNENSEEYSANTAFFCVQVNPSMSKSSVPLFTKDLNSSESDGRLVNYYNGLMAAPTIVEDYNIGISSLRNVNDDIYIDRGINYAFDKHLKLLEVKTFEALEQYNNGFFNIIDNNN